MNGRGLHKYSRHASTPRPLTPRARALARHAQVDVGTRVEVLQAHGEAVLGVGRASPHPAPILVVIVAPATPAHEKVEEIARAARAPLTAHLLVALQGLLAAAVVDLA